MVAPRASVGAESFLNLSSKRASAGERSSFKVSPPSRCSIKLETAMQFLRSDAPEVAHYSSMARVRATQYWPALVYGRGVNAYILLLVLTAGFGFSALAGAQAGATLIVKTDMNCNWTLDGQAMGLLKAGDSKHLPVSSGEHLIRAVTTDEVVAVRIKLAAVQGQKAIDIQLKSQHDQRLKNQLAEAARKHAEADAALTWTDPDTGLMWTRKDNG